MSIKIQTIEYALASNILNNDQLKDENPQRDLTGVFSKSGVKLRYVASDNETALDLSKKACDKLFDNSDMEKHEIDGVIYCTQTPDYLLPSNAFLIHDYLGLREDVIAFDYNLACSGYIYGLAIANGFLETGLAGNILLINSDTYSKIVNKKDLSTRVLFGDAAAVTIVSNTNKNEVSKVIDISLASSGKHFNTFYIPAGGFKTPKSEKTSIEDKDKSGNIRSAENIHMDGFNVWKFISYAVPKQINKLLKKNKIEVKDIKLFLFHQASQMTLDSIVKALDVKDEQLFINIESIGNTVSASIPIALKDAVSKGKLSRGDLIILCGFGVGLSWGSILMRY